MAAADVVIFSCFFFQSSIDYRIDWQTTIDDDDEQGDIQPRVCPWLGFSFAHFENVVETTSRAHTHITKENYGIVALPRETLQTIRFSSPDPSWPPLPPTKKKKKHVASRIRISRSSFSPACRRKILNYIIDIRTQVGTCTSVLLVFGTHRHRVPQTPAVAIVICDDGGW